MSAEILILLFLIAGIAGFVDAIAGGGGLLTIPALLFAGLSPVQSLATNKLQACFGSFSSTRHFMKSGLIDIRRSLWWIFLTAVGAIFGTLLVQQLDKEILEVVMPIALIVLAFYSLTNRSLGTHESSPKMSDKAYALSIASTVGAYDGFFGPGTGTFYTMANIRWLGMDFVKATGHAKLLNFVSNIVSLIVFATGGHLVIAAGLAMGAGQFIGARFGAATAIARGAGFIRILTIIMCLLMSAGLLIKFIR
ncbi:putative membrane transporter protein YfcA [BD1-7 clade bacterium]|uniref:Probable membrane transporter protein n=1 Tax=BD1-7 clade bacterium TaxID=2029982 RepID=A0A5S9PP69_9GAMM|nr:putative membrane transporter protein YfcA [BD1-7 clade bacterium]CAA0105779.1 putative membrane transporter protein YfcA [BD1-7 clade bacterium]